MLKELKTKRLERGWSQMDMCRMLEVSMPTYRLWENQVSTPKPENMDKLKKLFEEKFNN